MPASYVTVGDDGNISRQPIVGDLSYRSLHPSDEQIIYPLRRIAWRSNCVRRQIAAMIFGQDGRLISIGYNSPADPEQVCIKDCPRAISDVPSYSPYNKGPGRCIAIHAEDAALRKTTPEERKDGVMYITAKPCDDCRQLLESSGLARWEVVE